MLIWFKGKQSIYILTPEVIKAKPNKPIATVPTSTQPKA